MRETGFDAELGPGFGSGLGGQSLCGVRGLDQRSQVICQGLCIPWREQQAVFAVGDSLGEAARIRCSPCEHGDAAAVSVGEVQLAGNPITHSPRSGFTYFLRGKFSAAMTSRYCFE